MVRGSLAIRIRITSYNVCYTKLLRDQIEYAVARIGVDHVGIGTDFDHGSGIIGYKDASEARNLTRGLLERGYSAANIAKIWSGNFMRVMRAAEAAAGR